MNYSKELNDNRTDSWDLQAFYVEVQHLEGLPDVLVVFAFLCYQAVDRWLKLNFTVIYVSNKMPFERLVLK